MTRKELTQAAIECLAQVFKGRTMPPQTTQAAIAIVLAPELARDQSSPTLATKDHAMAMALRRYGKQTMAAGADTPRKDKRR